MKPFIIAELGSNPARYGWKLDGFVRAAKEAGADATKIQLFKAEHFPENEREEKRKVEFPRDCIKEFAELCKRHGLQSGASVFDKEAVELAAEHLDFLKLAAREQSNNGLIIDILGRELKKTVYRSISNGFNTLIVGMTHFLTVPQYPTPMARAITEMFLLLDEFEHKRWGKWNWEWGWSSHTRAILDCWLAVKLGATVIEKHFALSHSDPEGGHSLLSAEFRKMVKWLR